MVSLRSLITDPSCLELCNCSLPTIPAIIELKSPAGESTGSDMWVKNALYSLTRASQSEVTSPTGWLSDEVITAAQLLLLQPIWLAPHCSKPVRFRFTLESLSRSSMAGTITGVLSPLLAVRLVRSLCMTVYVGICPLRQNC